MGDARDESILLVIVGLPRLEVFLVHLFLDVRHVAVSVELVAGMQLVVELLAVLHHLILLKLLLTSVKQGIDASMSLRQHRILARLRFVQRLLGPNLVFELVFE